MRRDTRMASCAAGWRAALVRGGRVSGDYKRKSSGEMGDLRLRSPLTLYAGRQAGARQPVDPQLPRSAVADACDVRDSWDLFHRSGITG